MLAGLRIAGMGSPSPIRNLLFNALSTLRGVTARALNSRWMLSRGVSVFARYTFLFQHVDEPAWYPDIVRHVALLGVTLAVFGGDAEEVCDEAGGDGVSCAADGDGAEVNGEDIECGFAAAEDGGAHAGDQVVRAVGLDKLGEETVRAAAAEGANQNEREESIDERA